MSLYAFLGWGSALNFAFIFSAISTPACLSHTLYISALLPLAQPLTVTSSFSDDPKYTEDFSHFLCLAEEFSKNMCASNSEHFFPHCNPSPTVVASAMHSVTHKIQRFSLRIFFFPQCCPALSWQVWTWAISEVTMSCPALMPVLRSHCLEHHGSQDRESFFLPCPQYSWPPYPTEPWFSPIRNSWGCRFSLWPVLPGTLNHLLAPTEPYKFSTFSCFFLTLIGGWFLLLLWG